jgi:hypothetical protein
MREEGHQAELVLMHNEVTYEEDLYHKKQQKYLLKCIYSSGSLWNCVTFISILFFK